MWGLVFNMNVGYRYLTTVMALFCYSYSGIRRLRLYLIDKHAHLETIMTNLHNIVSWFGQHLP